MTAVERLPHFSTRVVPLPPFGDTESPLGFIRLLLLRANMWQALSAYGFQCDDPEDRAAFSLVASDISTIMKACVAVTENLRVSIRHEPDAEDRDTIRRVLAAVKRLSASGGKVWDSVALYQMLESELSARLGYVGEGTRR